MENKEVLETSLQEIGLAHEQALVYQTLLNLGPSKAFKIAFNSGIKRSLTYKILGQLQDIGLIESKETEEDKVRTFFPTHPSSLEALIEKKRESAHAAKYAFDKVAQSLISAYNIANKKPNVQFFEGDKGIQYVFDDIIKTKSDTLLFRSYLDTSSESINKMLDEHKERRKRFGLGMRLISSREPTIELSLQDKENNIARKYLPQDKFALPAQITVYSDKVAITSYGAAIVTTVIENPEIKVSFSALFELIWSQGVAPEEIFR
ncbi:helix-turn-helix domain-containing protein [Candidatus Parcubacteria bacterium]|nr:helix-turn-helix domain-containing protein [Candidatus Parcubacteria bacterium]